MASLTTTYMGLTLRNPVVVSSCGLTGKLESIIKAARAGAGAVVLKSLFEEQILNESHNVGKDYWESWHSEAYEYIGQMEKDFGIRNYLTLIEKVKSSIDIPVIASINCVSTKMWAEFARQIEAAGADAIELNVAVMRPGENVEPGQIEKTYLEIASEIKKHCKIPVAMKIGPYFTSLSKMAHDLSDRGIDGLVLFNRFYQFDIDIEKRNIFGAYQFSHPSEMALPLRWTSLLAGQIECDLAASTGIHDAKSVVKMIMAGAQVAQVCSVVYTKGMNSVETIVNELDAWCEQHNVKDINELRGILSKKNSAYPENYERYQYIRSLVDIDD